MTVRIMILKLNKKMEIRNTKNIERIRNNIQMGMFMDGGDSTCFPLFPGNTNEKSLKPID